MSGDDLDLAEVEAELGFRRPGRPRLLGYYTAAGIEYAYFQLGILQQVERLGYHDLRVEIYPEQPTDRVRLCGRFGEDPNYHVLMETALERRREPAGDVLFVHWLELRHPKGSWAAGRPALPGQGAPGLGMAREAGEVLARTAARLGCVGVVVRPAWFHVAWTARYRYRFRDPARQGRFLALGRDLSADPRLHEEPGGFQLARASRLVADAHVLLHRAGSAPTPYVWEADEMIDQVGPAADAEVQAAVERELSDVRFTFKMGG